MKYLITASTLACLICCSLMGCDETKKNSTSQKTTITTPVGKTTITTEKEVQQTGETPPRTTP